MISLKGKTAIITGASRGKVERICPSLEGGKSPASPASYSPNTGYFYVSTNNFCMGWQSVQSVYIPGTPYVGATVPYIAGPGGYLGALIAWDAALGKRAWEIHEKFPLWSGTTATAGGVVFYGTLDGWFKAANAKTGRPLWKFRVGSGVVGAPITYKGPDGKQYVAVYAGIGGDWFLISGDVVIFNVMGGIGTLVGPVVGAAFFLLLREGLSRFWTEYYLIPVGIIFTAMVIFMPQGLLGFAKRRLNQ